MCLGVSWSILAWLPWYLSVYFCCVLIWFCCDVFWSNNRKKRKKIVLALQKCITKCFVCFFVFRDTKQNIFFHFGESTTLPNHQSKKFQKNVPEIKFLAKPRERAGMHLWFPSGGKNKKHLSVTLHRYIIKSFDNTTHSPPKTHHQKLRWTTTDLANSVSHKNLNWYAKTPTIKNGKNYNNQPDQQPLLIIDHLSIY